MLEYSLINEAIQRRHNEVLNETFVGKEPVYKIQKAMDKIRDYMLSNPRGVLNGTDYEKDLEKAIQNVFGFKEVDVFWSSSQFQMRGPYTIVSCTIFNPSAVTSSVAYGKNQRGIYDKDHMLTACIHMPANIFSYGVTSEEAVAILLHELGHNFDITPNRMASDLIKIINYASTSNYFMLLFQAASGKRAVRSIMTRIYEIDTVISDRISIYRNASYYMQKIGKYIIDTADIMFSPLLLITRIPIMFITMPLNYIANYFGRKSERYADSVATMYGYGAELTTGLEKIVADTAGGNTVLAKAPVTKTLYDLYRAEGELMDIALGKHESTQKRLIKSIAMLKQDLNDQDLSPAFKRQIKNEIARLEETYRSVITMPDEQKPGLQTLVRRLMDVMYDGKPYVYFEPTTGDYIK